MTGELEPTTDTTSPPAPGVTFSNHTTSWVIQSNVTDARPLWDKGLRGEGQIIGHIDGPIELDSCFFRDATNNQPRPGHRKVVGVRKVVAGDVRRGHGTFTAGIAAGEDLTRHALSANPNPGNGQAPRARLTHGYLLDLAVAQAGGTASFFDYLVAAHQDGARVHSNSWQAGTTSRYTAVSADLDRFTWEHEDDLVVLAGENSGPIRAPSTSKNGLVVNACRQSPNQGSFAAGITMFTLDGRRKPELMAPGQDITSAGLNLPCATFSDASPQTSYATPAVAGAAALVRQYFTGGWYPTGKKQPSNAMIPTGALLKAVLVNATVDAGAIAGYPGSPSSGEGWGRLLLDDGHFFDGDQRRLTVWDVPHAIGLQAGDVVTRNLTVTGAGQPLKVTLVWTEPPADPDTPNPVINDVDLEVRSPTGSTFLGNHFVNGQSATGGTADRLNNVERVVVNAAPAGRWTIVVRATTVVTGKPRQGYALVATSGSPPSRCFVASAVYGDDQHPDVVRLRAWRDRRLATGARGRGLIVMLQAAYDVVGPPLGRLVARHPACASLVRRLALAPLAVRLRR